MERPEALRGEERLIHLELAAAVLEVGLAHRPRLLHLMVRVQVLEEDAKRLLAVERDAQALGPKTRARRRELPAQRANPEGPPPEAGQPLLEGLGHQRGDPVVLRLPARRGRPCQGRRCLREVAPLQLQLHVARRERGPPVRDQKRRAAPHQAIHGLEDRGFGLHVDRARGLVEDQERRVLQERARERDALALAAGELHPALPDRRRVAPRQADDEVVRARCLRGPRDVEVARRRAPVGDVLRDAAREQHGLLEHDGELFAQVGEAVVPQVDAVEEDGAGRRVVESGEEAHERRLPGARRPHDRNPRARLHLEGDVAQYRVLAVVGEADLPERHRAGGAHQRTSVGSLGDVGPLV